MNKVGEKLADTRRALGISQDELASRAGISRIMLSYIENGRRTPSLEMLQKLAWAMDCSLNISFEQAGLSPEEIKGLDSLI